MHILNFDFWKPEIYEKKNGNEGGALIAIRPVTKQIYLKSADVLSFCFWSKICNSQALTHRFVFTILCIENFSLAQTNG